MVTTAPDAAHFLDYYYYFFSIYKKNISFFWLSSYYWL